MKCDRCKNEIEDDRVKRGLQVRVLENSSQFDLNLTVDLVTNYGYGSRQAKLCRACLYALLKKFRDVVKISEDK